MTWLWVLLFSILTTVSIANRMASRVAKTPHLAIYRLFTGNDHFYTTNEDEYKKVLKDSPKFKYGKICGYLGKQAEGSVNVPMYRYYSKLVDRHICAATAAHIKEVEDAGYTRELRMGFCSDPAQSGMAAFHRFWNSKTNDHVRTFSQVEYDNLTSISGKGAGWVHNGINCYVYTS